MPLLNYVTPLAAGLPKSINALKARFDEVKEVVNALTNINIAEDAEIDPAKIALANAIATAMLQDDSVTSAKIGDDQVLTVHIADDQITVALMAADSVGAEQLIDGSVGPDAVAAWPETKVSLAAGTDSVGGGGEDSILWNTEVVDDLGAWEAGNPTVYTIPDDGWYLVYAEINADSSAFAADSELHISDGPTTYASVTLPSASFTIRVELLRYFEAAEVISAGLFLNASGSARAMDESSFGGLVQVNKG